MREESDDEEFPDVVSPSFTIIRDPEAPPFPSHNKKGDTKNKTKISSGSDFYWWKLLDREGHRH